MATRKGEKLLVHRYGTGRHASVILSSAHQRRRKTCDKTLFEDLRSAASKPNAQIHSLDTVYPIHSLDVPAGVSPLAYC
eukprot:scaffold34226_cov44-Attheya_sp.AAC.3